MRPRDPVRNSGMQSLQAAVRVVPGHVVTVYGDQQALEPRRRQRLDVPGEEPAIGDQPTLNACLGRRRDEPGDIGVYQGLPTLEGHVSDSPPTQDRHRSSEFGQVDVTARTDKILVARETAEIACGVADVRDRNVTHGRQQIPAYGVMVTLGLLHAVSHVAGVPAQRPPNLAQCGLQ